LELGGEAGQGHLDKKLPILEAFQVEKSRDGRWLATFSRKAPPRQDPPVSAHAAENLSPVLVDRISDAVGGDDDRPWWTQCVKRLGPGAVDGQVNGASIRQRWHRKPWKTWNRN
jgi:hypothetical protein